MASGNPSSAIFPKSPRERIPEPTVLEELRISYRLTDPEFSELQVLDQKVRALGPEKISIDPENRAISQGKILDNDFELRKVTRAMMLIVLNRGDKDRVEKVIGQMLEEGADMRDVTYSIRGCLPGHCQPLSPLEIDNELELIFSGIRYTSVANITNRLYIIYNFYKVLSSIASTVLIGNHIGVQSLAPAGVRPNHVMRLRGRTRGDISCSLYKSTFSRYFPIYRILLQVYLYPRYRTQSTLASTCLSSLPWVFSLIYLSIRPTMPSAKQVYKAIQMAELEKANRLAREAREAQEAQGVADRQQAESSRAGTAHQEATETITASISSLRSLMLAQLKREYEACMHLHRNLAAAANLHEATKTYEEVKTIIEEHTLLDLDKLHRAFKNKMAVVLQRSSVPTQNDVFKPTGIAAGLGITCLPGSYANLPIVTIDTAQFDAEDKTHWPSYPLSISNQAYRNIYAEQAQAVRHEHQPLGHVSQGDIPTPGFHSHFTPINRSSASGGATPPGHSRSSSTAHSSPAVRSPGRFGGASHSRNSSATLFSPSPDGQIEAAHSLLALYNSGQPVDSDQVAAARTLLNMRNAEQGPPFT
ncbi:hypothetical protein K491DRAFT_674308 [Lophiostoma macrostomum CBS 122681]|uniref:Uncharacterized protein n=1 Tax=Lophiostoma macrostomum CBS 122681 TaxID=1314788 RepID=A0A6A6TQW1_9PLEO|nr:hypothetical protein K491DRAFT_674308 [Lophiostoma macrostomum CBS 122681]